MNGKRAKAIRRTNLRVCQATGINCERDLTQVNNKGSLELEKKTVRASYKALKVRVKNLSRHAG